MSNWSTGSTLDRQFWQFHAGVMAPGVAAVRWLIQEALRLTIREAERTGHPVVIPGFASVRVVEKKARRTLGRDGYWYDVPARRRVAIRPTKKAHAQVER